MIRPGEVDCHLTSYICRYVGAQFRLERIVFRPIRKSLKRKKDLNETLKTFKKREEFKKMDT